MRGVVNIMYTNENTGVKVRDMVKPGDLTLIPGTHVAEGDNGLLQILPPTPTPQPLKKKKEGICR